MHYFTKTGFEEIAMNDAAPDDDDWETVPSYDAKNLGFAKVRRSVGRFPSRLCRDLSRKKKSVGFSDVWRE